MIDNADRCAGSLQQTMTADGPSPCPACGQLVAVIQIDDLPALVEHSRQRPEALPLALDLW